MCTATHIVCSMIDCGVPDRSVLDTHMGPWVLRQSCSRISLDLSSIRSTPKRGCFPPSNSSSITRPKILTSPGDMPYQCLYALRTRTARLSNGRRKKPARPTHARRCHHPSHLNHRGGVTTLRTACHRRRSILSCRILLLCLRATSTSRGHTTHTVAIILHWTFNARTGIALRKYVCM